VLEVHAVVDAVRDLSFGVIFDIQVETHGRGRVVGVISRVISISRVTNDDFAAGHYVKLGRCQFNEFAKVIHS
jgi:hypothetical protein